MNNLDELNGLMKDVVNKMKELGKSDDEIARAEIFIQYFLNDEFREWLNDFVFKMTYKPQK